MSEPVEVRFQWTVDEALAAMRANQRARRNVVSRFMLPAGGLLLFLMGVDIIIHSGVMGSGPYALMIGLLLLTNFTVIQPLALRWQFKKRPDRDAELAWTIDDDLIAIRSKNGSSDLRWSAFAKVVQARDGFLFYSNALTYHWLPRKGFSSDLDLQRLSDLVQKHVSTFKRIS